MKQLQIIQRHLRPLFTKGLIISSLLLFSVPGAPFFSCPAMAGEPQIIITADRQFTYADQVFKNQDPAVAEVEFKRFIHFFPDDPRVPEARFKIAMTLFLQEKYQKAALIFETIIREGRGKAETHKAYVMQSRAFARAGNTGYAQVVLQNLLMLTQDSHTRDQIYLDLVRLCLESDPHVSDQTLDRAQKMLSQISESNAVTFKKNELIGTIEKARRSPKKNPTLAGILSLIPGAGFLYCERYYDAFVSFAFNTGMIYAAYESFDRDLHALGGIISFVEAGFYAGNIYGSISSAHKINRNLRLKILDRDFTLNSRLDPEQRSYSLLLEHPF